MPLDFFRLAAQRRVVGKRRLIGRRHRLDGPQPPDPVTIEMGYPARSIEVGLIDYDMRTLNYISAVDAYFTRFHLPGSPLKKTSSGTKLCKVPVRVLVSKFPAAILQSWRRITMLKLENAH
jgi:hypothetical protein